MSAASAVSVSSFVLRPVSGYPTVRPALVVMDDGACIHHTSQCLRMAPMARPPPKSDGYPSRITIAALLYLLGLHAPLLPLEGMVNKNRAKKGVLFFRPAGTQLHAACLGVRVYCVASIAPFHR